MCQQNVSRIWCSSKTAWSSYAVPVIYISAKHVYLYILSRMTCVYPKYILSYLILCLSLCMKVFTFLSQLKFVLTWIPKCICSNCQISWERTKVGLLGQTRKTSSPENRLTAAVPKLLLQSCSSNKTHSNWAAASMWE